MRGVPLTNCTNLKARHGKAKNKHKHHDHDDDSVFSHKGNAPFRLKNGPSNFSYTNDTADEIALLIMRVRKVTKRTYAF